MTEIRALARMLWRHRASTAAAILTLGAGIAAATCGFALADAALWRELPYREPRSLVLLVTAHQRGEANVSLPDFLAVRDAAGAARVAAAGAFTPELALTGFGEPRQLRGRVLSADYFATLGVALVAGRDFTREEEKPGAGQVAIITDRLWNELFGRRPALGAPLTLNGRTHLVAGILPPFTDFLGDVDIYVPYQFAPALPRRLRLLAAVVRLADPRDLEGFSAGVREWTRSSDPEAAGYTVEAVGLHERLAARGRSDAWLLLGSSLGLLAIALVNFATLMAARVRQRQAEFSTRLALGATRARVLGLAAMEAAALGLAGAASALACSRMALPLLERQFGPLLVNDVQVGARAGAFAFAVALGAAATVLGSARSLGRSIPAERRIVSSRLRGGVPLVAAQIGLSLALVLVCGLMARGLAEARRMDPGFPTSGIVTSRVALPAGQYRDISRRVVFWRTLLERFVQTGVGTIAISTEVPLTGEDNPTSFTARLADGTAVASKIRSVSPDYLETLGVPLLQGRSLSAEDRAGARPVLAVNQGLAAHLASLGSPIGQTLTFDFGGSPYHAIVIGVVGNVRHERLSAAPLPEAYFPFEQTPLTTYSLVVRTDRPARDVHSAIRATLDTIDRGQPFAPVVAMEDHVQRGLAGPRVQAQLLGCFAIVALLVSAAGLYSLLAFLVAGARREWALRLALGAAAADLRRLVLRQAAACAAIGLVLGLGTIVVFSRPLGAMAFGVSPWDPLLVAVTVVVMMVTTIGAAVIPALRIGRISPAEVLQ
jgi:putative ABC transport system permease protein